MIHNTAWQHSTQLVWTHMICEKYDTQDENGHVKHTDTWCVMCGTTWHATHTTQHVTCVRQQSHVTCMTQHTMWWHTWPAICLIHTWHNTFNTYLWFIMVTMHKQQTFHFKKQENSVIVLSMEQGLLAIFIILFYFAQQQVAPCLLSKCFRQ